MSSVRVLINAAIATAATKIPFDLTAKNFKLGSTPALRAAGMGVGDDVFLWVWIAGAWVSLGSVLDDVTFTYPISTMGQYAVTIVMAGVGPATCELHCYAAG